MPYPTHLQISGRRYDVKYKPVLKATSSVRIKKGEVVLNLSRFVHGEQRDKMVAKFLKWAEKKLVRAAKSGDSYFVNPVYENGARIVTHNKVYELEIFCGLRKNAACKIEGNLLKIFVPIDEVVDIKNLAEKAIIKDQTPYLHEVLDELNQLHFQEKFKNCRFKRTSGRFGSCSSRGNINIAFRLLFAPREVFKYVCIHELAHLKEMNHSRRFWDCVADACPDYEKCEKWLKDNGVLLG